jgi:hypothetical protein
LPVGEKEEVSDEYFFDHLKDDISKEDHGESEKDDDFNRYNAESEDHSVEPVCDVVAESSTVGPEQCITTRLLKKQVEKKNSSDVPMSLRHPLKQSLMSQLLRKICSSNQRQK